MRVIDFRSFIPSLEDLQILDSPTLIEESERLLRISGCWDFEEAVLFFYNADSFPYPPAMGINYEAMRMALIAKAIRLSRIEIAGSMKKAESMKNILDALIASPINI
jgi:hypothetical protein